MSVSSRSSNITSNLNLLDVWETLLESRIVLQKCLVACNKLPKHEHFENVWHQCSQDEKNIITEHREHLWDLLEKLINLQHDLRKQYSEYTETTSEITEKNENLDQDVIQKKRRKLIEYPHILEKQISDFAEFRNNTIQKWNERTKILSGKYSKSNFSAFDQPILKQIELILSDKQNLIQRTYVKRSEYKIISHSELADVDEINDKTSSPVINREIFDDDDFYHKLLRDFIQRKTANVSDSTQYGRKWINLQNLRSKMKKNIDTRRTKERKIKFDVHPKLINFMVPINTNCWSDAAINELYNSVFGKNIRT